MTGPEAAVKIKIAALALAPDRAAVDPAAARPAGGVRVSDPVNHPTHYADGWSNGAEVIDIAEHLNFCRGNAVKYLARAGAKDPAKELEDLRKARWYVDREIARLEGAEINLGPSRRTR